MLLTILLINLLSIGIHIKHIPTRNWFTFKLCHIIIECSVFKLLILLILFEDPQYRLDTTKPWVCFLCSPGRTCQGGPPSRSTADSANRPQFQKQTSNTNTGSGLAYRRVNHGNRLDALTYQISSWPLICTKNL